MVGKAQSPIVVAESPTLAPEAPSLDAESKRVVDLHKFDSQKLPILIIPESRMDRKQCDDFTYPMLIPVQGMMVHTDGLSSTHRSDSSGVKAGGDTTERTLGEQHVGSPCAKRSTVEYEPDNIAWLMTNYDLPRWAQRQRPSPLSIIRSLYFDIAAVRKTESSSLNSSRSVSREFSEDI